MMEMGILGFIEYFLLTVSVMALCALLFLYGIGYNIQRYGLGLSTVFNITTNNPGVAIATSFMLGSLIVAVLFFAVSMLLPLIYSYERTMPFIKSQLR